MRTTIVAPSGIYAELEEGSRDRFSLPEAIVIEGSADRDGAIMALIGEEAAHNFEVAPPNEEVIGISSRSETILKMVDNVRPMRSNRTGLFGKITLSIVGIGAVEPSSMLARNGNAFLASELAEAAEAGGVGDIGPKIFDKIGRPVKTPLDNRVNGMTLEKQARTDRVFALAGGRAETDAIRGALMTREVDVLISDKFTAERLQETGPDHGTEAN
ncbi:MAG: hypothetical protein OXI01_23400 [Albidovulum sp.]|nr:hypothetical protein [Albidovulum sp.]